MTDYSIPLTGLAANDPVPGTYFEVNFAQGEASGAGGLRALLLIGNKTTSGSATADTVVYGPTSDVQLANQDDADTLFGEGSELARMYSRAVRILAGTTVPVHALVVTESAGAKATGTITLATTSTKNVTVRVWCGDEFVDTPVVNGDSVTTAATAVVAKINAQNSWPIVATNNVGVITIEAKQKGPRGNLIRYSAQILEAGGAMTVTPLAATAMTGGTTADVNTTALTTILPSRYYYIASAHQDATNLGRLVTQVNTQAEPISGIRQRVFAGSSDTSGNAITIATGLNAARCEIAWLEESDVVPAELAVQLAAVAAFEEAPDVPRCNFDGYGGTGNTASRWHIRAPRSGSAPTRTEIATAIINGLSPIGCGQNGATYLVSRVTTKCLNGSDPDARIRDAHKVTVCDRFADDAQAKINAQFSGMLIGDDPVAGQRPPGPRVLTPRVMKAALVKLVDEYGAKDLLQQVDTIKSATVAIRESNPRTRLTARVPLRPIDVAHQIGVVVDQVS